jgi:regulator of nucleoside diphosphate kinase
MPSKSKTNGAVKAAARNPIHITSRDKQLLEDLLAQVEAMRSEPRTDLAALSAELQRAVIVQPDEIPADVITMDTRAEMLDLETGETVTFTLVFPSQANIDEEKISVLAPIGAGMLGYRVGDEFEWRVPAGIRRMRVTKIHYQPEAASNGNRTSTAEAKAPRRAAVNIT